MRYATYKTNMKRNEFAKSKVNGLQTHESCTARNPLCETQGFHRATYDFDLG